MVRLWTVLFFCSACANNAPSGDTGPRDGGDGACPAIEARAAECGPSECISGITSQCEFLAGLVNDDFERAFGACLGTDAPLGECMLEGRAAVTPTDAHRTFATAFCASCVTIPAAPCEVGFFDEDSAETGVAGTFILPLTDELALQAAERCTDGPTCGADVADCLAGVLRDQGVSMITASCLGGAFVDGVIPGCGTTDAGVDAALDGGIDGGIDAGVDAGCSNPDEPNDERADAVSIGMASDRDDYPKGNVVGALVEGDEDWFSFTVEDQIGGTTGPRVDYRGPDEICLYYECDSGDGEITCDEGEADGEGCCSASRVKLGLDCSGLDESGTVFVQVRTDATPTCANYDFDWGDD